MTEIESAVVRLLREAINNNNTDAQWLTEENWPDIYKELKAQTVAFIPAEAVLKSEISKEQKLEYTKALATNIRNFHKVMTEQTGVLELLEKENIPAVVLKGAAAAVYYPHPEYRQMGDIDLIVEPENFERAKDLLLDNGYKLHQEGDDNKRHTGMDGKMGIKIELHRYFSSSDNAVENEILDNHIYDGIRNRIIRNVCGYNVPMLPDVENGLVLLGHINQHLGGGLGLRQIFDWMFYAKDVLNDEMWSSEVCIRTEAIGMRTLAETVTMLCRRYFGLQSVSCCENTDTTLPDELLEYVLVKGNFGKKHGYKSNATITVLHYFINPITAFRYLTAGGMSHWKAAKKHQILRPFAWLYQIMHLIRMGLSRKVDIKTLGGEVRQSQKEVDFLNRLRITRK